MVLDVTTVGSELTSEQQDEVLEDLAFFLDNFGSTYAVRVKLHEQKSDIQRLESQIKRLIGLADGVSREQEEDFAVQDNAQAGDNVERVMTDLDFFLRTFGSTRAVRDKLQSQSREIAGLQRMLQWLEMRQQENDESSDVEYLFTKPVLTPTEQGNNHSSGCGREMEKVCSGGEETEESYAYEFYEPQSTRQAQVLRSPSTYQAPSATTEVRLRATGQREASQSSAKRSIDETQATQISDVVPETPPTEAAKVVMASSELDVEQIEWDDYPGVTAETASAMPKSRISHHCRCRYPNCQKFAQMKGLCCRHGGYRMCKTIDCNRRAVSRSLCYQHGGGSRCKFDECPKMAYSKGYCSSHSLQRAHETEMERAQHPKHQTEAVECHSSCSSTATCQSPGCREWGMQNGETRYCSIHQELALWSHKPSAKMTLEDESTK